ncbi:MAG: hypothetical protein ACKVU2_04210 [Saprospiraceae bacterium]
MNFEPKNQTNRTLSLYRKVCGEIEPPQATFSISKQGEGRVSAYSEEKGIYNIGLKLENGKWLLTNFGCVAAAAK